MNVAALIFFLNFILNVTAPSVPVYTQLILIIYLQAVSVLTVKAVDQDRAIPNKVAYNITHCESNNRKRGRQGQTDRQTDRQTQTQRDKREKESD